MRRIFSDMLGQIGVDYISIALINTEHEIFFLSSHPSIEQNLIEKELWMYDSIYKTHFINQNERKLWSEIPPLAHAEQLKQYKHHSQKLIEGVSIPIDYGIYRAILSFGFKKMNFLTHVQLNNYEKLLALGCYCLNRISNTIIFPDQETIIKKPKLTLIINNIGK